MLTRLACGRVVGLVVGILAVALLALLGVFSSNGPASANPATGVLDVSLGTSHACLVNGSGGAECWGRNTFGQIGLPASPIDGTYTATRNSPNAVGGLASGVTAVAGGGVHSCALLTGGGVSCWGGNELAQGGNGTVVSTEIPSSVTGISTATAITAGEAHTCAVLASASLSCWGLNSTDQLGAPSGDNCGDIAFFIACSLTPIAVTSLAGSVAQASAGALHTCAVTTSGGAKCWGSNSFGQLGDGTTVDRLTPVDVTGLTSGTVQVAAGGQHNCALTGGGGVKCWGLNQAGQLGDGSTTTSFTPVDVTGLSTGVTAVFVGQDHSCALMSIGTMKCWGSNSEGALGDGTTVDRHTPTDVIGLSDATLGAAGTIGTCALLSGGALWCWGLTLIVGDGTWLYRTSPTHIKGLSTGVADVSVGAGHACVLTTAGGVKCWGANEWGQLGDGTRTSQHEPVDVVGLSSGVIAISAGHRYSCAVTAAGAVKCWGAYPTGSCMFISCLTPVTVAGIGVPVDDVAVGHAPGGEFGLQGDTCALTTTGGVKCWGINLGGLPDGGPTDITGLTTGVVSVSVGGIHACVVTTTNQVQCWGINDLGALGDGTTTSTSVPVAVLSDVNAVSAGLFHTCAVTTTGDVKCWGGNEYGQIGATSPEFCVLLAFPCSTIPIDVVGLGGIGADVDAGDRHTCAVTTAGGVKCWGDNVSGQLGDASLVDSTVPVDVVRSASGFEKVSVGGFTSCALTLAGRVECWGQTLGPGDDRFRTVPVPVVELTVKPIPTQTPCGPEGCPTPTDTPTASPTPPPTDTPVPGDEPAMALAVLDAGGNEVCHSDVNAKCEISAGSSFRLVVEIVRRPTVGYILAQSWIDWGAYNPEASEDGAGPGTCSDGFDNGRDRGDRFDPDCLTPADLTQKPRASAADEIAWPDCQNALALRSGANDLGYAAHTCLTGLIPPLPASEHTGSFLELDFNCSANVSTTDVNLLAFNQPNTITSGALFVLPDDSRIVPLVSNLTINCVDAAPAAVGGVALGGELRGISAQHGNAPWLWAALGLGAIVTLSVLAFARHWQAAGR